MSGPLVTIGIASFNCEQFLPMLLTSIRSQHFQDWEIVAIDDASTDRTPEILHQCRGSRVRVVLETENRGLGARLNQIAALAKGRYLARTDADDLFHPERLVRQLDILCRDPRIDVCTTGTYCIDESNRVLGVRRIPALAHNAREVMERNGPSHPTVTASTEWFQRYPYAEFPKRGQDLDLWIRSIEDSAIVQMPDPLHFIREPQTFDFSKYRRSQRDHRLIFRRHGGRHGGAGLVAGLVARSFAKEFVAGVGSKLGLDYLLAARRNISLGAVELAEVQSLVDRMTTRSGDSTEPTPRGFATARDARGEVSSFRTWGTT